MIFHFQDGTSKVIDLGEGATFDVGVPRRKGKRVVLKAINPDTFRRFREQGGEEILQHPDLIESFEKLDIIDDEKGE